MSQDDRLTPDLEALDRRLRQAVADTARGADMARVGARVDAHVRRRRGLHPTARWVGVGALALVPAAAVALLAVAALRGGAPAPAPATGSPPTPAPAGRALRIDGVRMVDARNGWTVDRRDVPGGAVLRTADGGRTWTDVTPHDPTGARVARPAGAALVDQRIDAAYFYDARRAWIAVSAAVPGKRIAMIFDTTDGGASWGGVSPLDWDGASSQLEFVDASTGWWLSNGTDSSGMARSLLSVTTDGGNSWTYSIWQGAPHGACFPDRITFVDRSTGYRVANGCRPSADSFQVTHDGGRTWAPAPLKIPADVEAVWAPTFMTHVRGLMLALRGPSRQPALLATADGGLTWTRAGLPPGVPDAEPDFVSSSVAFAVVGTAIPGSRAVSPVASPPGFGLRGLELYRTTDGGATWTGIPSNLVDSQYLDTGAVDFAERAVLDFVDARTGWAAGIDGRGALLHTTDGGQTWLDLQPRLVP